MLRRPSGSTDEDGPEDPAPSEPRNGPFTSAKYNASRCSDTLDHRRADKILLPSEWNAAEDNRHEKQEQAQITGTTEGGEKQALAMDYRDWRRPRLRSPWKSSILTLLVTALSGVFVLTVINSFLTRQLDPKGCNRCWMRPIFAEFKGFDTEHTRFASKYSLYLYREAGVNEDFTVGQGRGYMPKHN